MQKVSVIIPVYNAAEFLAETLDSVLSQTYKNLEIICVNDGSTDRSLSVLKKYQDKIRIIDQENQGQCIAANKGLQAASGDYIRFLDADDLMNKEHISLQVGRLKGKSDALASCEWGRFYDGNSESATFNPEPVWKDLKSKEWITEALKQENEMMPGWLWLIPRPLLDKAGGWDERLSLNNDFEFSMRLLLHANEVIFTPGARIYYRSGLANNLAASASENAFRAAILSTELGFEHLEKIKKSEEVRQLYANRLQKWVYRMYPHYPDLVKETEEKIRQLGGSSNRIEGGRVFQLLSGLAGWKLTKRFQLISYKMGYKPKHPHLFQ
ncbi:MAG: glycosyltransferase family 2 protein [Cyclobacteriaceae bacterium]